MDPQIYSLRGVKTLPNGVVEQYTSPAGTEFTVTKYPENFLDSGSGRRITVELYKTVVHSDELGDTSVEKVHEMTIPDDWDEIYIMNRPGDTVDSYSLTEKKRNTGLRNTKA
jgi:hypothetical protein